LETEPEFARPIRALFGAGRTRIATVRADGSPSTFDAISDPVALLEEDAAV
jgi:hypothetical protein